MLLGVKCCDYLVHFADVNKTLIQLQLYVHGPPPGKELIIDCFHMTALELDDSWKMKALSRIESFRKSSLTLNVKSFSGNYDNLTLEVGLRLNSCVHAFTWKVTLFDELLFMRLTVAMCCC